MKRLTVNIIMIIALAALLIMGTSGILQAAVSGQCDNCHTMHNSQDGAAMTVDGAAANTFLTQGDCLGCHGGVVAGATVGGAPDVFGTVIGTGGDMCAGGTFNQTIVDDCTKVHNVNDIATWTDPEDNLTGAPGTEEAFSNAITVDATNSGNFSCAGATGCHGDHDALKTTSDLGIKGFHHGSTAYRYCQTSDADPIEGIGSTDWEKGGATDTNHNVYYADSTGVYGINAFCAECHGDFHGTDDTGTGSPFERHPTNNLLSDASGWDIGFVNVDPLNNPFCFTEADVIADSIVTTAAYTATNARVACVSCHRAHGTGNSDILRFDYSTQTAGTTTEDSGCLGCHYKQR